MEILENIKCGAQRQRLIRFGGEENLSSMWDPRL